MKTNRNSAARSKNAMRTAAAISMTLLICSSAACGKRVDYVNGDHKLTRLKQGQSAPRDGVLISENYLAEIFETLGQPKPSIAKTDSKSAPAASSASSAPGYAAPLSDASAPPASAFPIAGTKR